MARKIMMNGQSRKAVAEVCEDFVISQTAQGLSPVTITNYRNLKSLDRLVKGALDEVKAIEDQKAVAENPKEMANEEVKEAPVVNMAGI